MQAGRRVILNAARATSVALAAVGLAQCDREPAPPVPAAPGPAPVITTPNPSLGRADLLNALDDAASAYAAGQPLDGALTGRTFLIKLAFACAGESTLAPAGTPTARRSRSGADLDLGLTPADWTRSPLVLTPGEAPTWERVEGLAIARPWLKADGCPAQTAPASVLTPTGTAAEGAESPPAPVVLLPPAPAATTAGLAVISSANTSRLGRRAGEAWTHTVRGETGAPAVTPTSGYRLVLGGRIGRFPDGRPVRCTSAGIDTRPVCIAAVELDLVAFEDAAGARLSEWRPT